MAYIAYAIYLPGLLQKKFADPCFGTLGICIWLFKKKGGLALFILSLKQRAIYPNHWRISFPCWMGIPRLLYTLKFYKYLCLLLDGAILPQQSVFISVFRMRPVLNIPYIMVPFITGFFPPSKQIYLKSNVINHGCNLGLMLY